MDTNSSRCKWKFKQTVTNSLWCRGRNALQTQELESPLLQQKVLPAAVLFRQKKNNQDPDPIKLLLLAPLLQACFRPGVKYSYFFTKNSLIFKSTLQL